MDQSRITVLGTILVTATSLQVSFAQGYHFRAIALQDAPAPGTEPGVTFNQFNSTLVVIDNDGAATFRARVKGPGVAANLNDLGIWTENAGVLSLVARVGFSAPGVSGGIVFKSFHDPLIGIPGITVIPAFIQGPGISIGVNDYGIWSNATGSLDLVARRGTAAPGLPDTEFSVFNSPSASSSGRTAFFSLLQGAGVGASDFRSIWSDGGGTLHLVARMGSEVAGANPGTVFENFGAPRINANGQTAFRAQLSGPSVSAGNDIAILSEAANSLSIVGREGDPAPGLGAGVFFDDLNDVTPAWNDLGQTAFAAGMLGTGVATDSDRGVWSEGSGALDLVAREGDQAPGVEPGTVFSEVLVNEIPGYPGDPFQLPAFVGVVIIGTGQSAFAAGLCGVGVDDSNLVGLWSEANGTLSLIARSGDHAPGTPIGVNFAFFGYLLSDAIAMNSEGNVAFRGILVGDGVTSLNNTGIWAEDPDGGLQLVVRAGDQIELAPGDLRFVSHPGFASGSGGQDGVRTGFNDLGQIAFVASFSDGTSGVILATPCNVGDMNDDDIVDALDVAPFASVLVSPDDASAAMRCAADVNGDSFVDGLDIAALVEALLL